MTALELIAKEKKEKTGKLDIGKCGLTELPEELFDLERLEELYVSNRFWDYKKQEWIESKNPGSDNRVRSKKGVVVIARHCWVGYVR